MEDGVSEFIHKLPKVKSFWVKLSAVMWSLLSEDLETQGTASKKRDEDSSNLRTIWLSQINAEIIIYHLSCAWDKLPLFSSNEHNW